MSLPIILYLIDLVENINFTLAFFFLFIFIGFGVSAFVGFVEQEFGVFHWFKKKLWIGVAITIIGLFFPSKQTMYLMLGAGYLQDSKLPHKVSQALELKLDDVIEQLKKEKEKK